MKKTIRVLIICVLALATVTVGVTALRLWNEEAQLSLDLNGEREIYLEYGQRYEEPGAVAMRTHGNNTEEIPVEISGQVNEAELGRYLIKYTAQTEDIIRTDYRYVHVVDTQAPIITLNTIEGAFTLLNHPYQEEGFTAIDNRDGDLTAQVTYSEADGVMTYTVSDSSGNIATANRTIHYIDPGMPEITLEGSPIAFIMAGEAYAEPGFHANDINDGDLTETVIVTGSVDPNTPGIYTVTYAATNHYGVTASAERIVYVIPQQTEETPPADEPPADAPTDTEEEQEPTGGVTIEPNGKVIYLTFDDGPSQHTGRLLDVLAKYNVKATFFVVNTSYIDMIARAAQEGHTVAVHTLTHRYNEIYASDSAYMADFQAMQSIIKQHTGQDTKLFRFPGGSSNSVSRSYNKGIMTRLTARMQEMGYRYFDWNVGSEDTGGANTSEAVFNNVINGIMQRNTSVVLQHDIYGYSVDAVERIIAWGLCNGYTFLPLTYDSPQCHHPVNN